jgi:hypothetical protein
MLRASVLVVEGPTIYTLLPVHSSARLRWWLKGLMGTHHVGTTVVPMVVTLEVRGGTHQLC